MKLSDKQILFEQLALLFASFVWTTVILAAIAAFWAYQDVQARWEFVLNAPPEALAQAVASPTVTLTPTPTVWSPPPTLTPSPTKPPTPTATWVVPPPNFLPETLNPGEPTPIPVTVQPGDQAPQVDAPPATPTPVPPAPVVESTPQPQPPAQDPTPAPPPVPAPNPPAGDGAVPTHLVVPSVGIDANVTSVGWQMVEQNGQQFSIWQVADYAVGWHEASARLGQPGNTVMAGHHNVNGEVFRDLVNVEVGDKVEIYAGEQKFEYQVELKTIVKEKGEPIEVRQRNAQWIASTTDERITLVTCWPYTNNTHRVIVVAKRL